MRELVKSFIRLLPSIFRTSLLRILEYYNLKNALKKERAEYGNLILGAKKETNASSKILIYHITGLSHGGTEKTLQILANGLCAIGYDVYFMTTKPENETSSRESFLDDRVKRIFFKYKRIESKPPYFIHGMNPHIKKVIIDNYIDTIITTSDGYSNYPINTITNIPIILINIFGSPTVQNNIYNVYISETVRLHSAKYSSYDKNGITLFCPIATSPQDTTSGKLLRSKLGIKDTDFAFGRIGRNSDAIHDPIGIKAFEAAVKIEPNIHYIIMSPPPALVTYIELRKIPNAHLLEPSASEDIIWAFHHSLDCFAHFRYDGETCGLAIAESLSVGNPVISHKSRIWNAHCEYLNDEFSRVVQIDDINSYTKAMIEFAQTKRGNNSEWNKMRVAAKICAEKNFSQEKYAKAFAGIISSNQLSILH